MSTNFGIAFIINGQFAVAIKLNDGTRIWDFLLIFKANNAACPADVPELNDTQYFVPTYLANSFSKFSISGPIAQSIPLLIT